MNIKGFKNSLEWKKIFNSNEFQEKYTYLGNDLGNSYSKNETVFKIWAPTADKVCLNLYTEEKYNENSKKINTFNMKEIENGVWFLAIKKDLKNLYYTYTITANGKINETNDINAKACGINGQKSMIIDLKETNPKNWEKDTCIEIEKKDTIIYELHIKDFSYHENSGIDENFKGKYLAFTQKGTHLPDDENFPTGIDYLKSLGITYVHLLPFYDFGSIDEASGKDDFNWGYDPINYNVPEGSYSTNAYDGKIRIKEAKQMIQALHNVGIGVIMDVVFNHTYSLNSNFNKTVPYYYYRIDENGEYSNGTACGNETASENIMYRKYMIDSILYWAEEYHLDGFRFDLMGIHDTETMNEIRKALDLKFGKGKILIYGEPWTASKTAIKEGYFQSDKNNLNLLDENIGAFCDIIRDLIKGDVFIEKNSGYVNGNNEFYLKLKNYLYNLFNNKNIENFNVKYNKQFINYISAHDNLTLWDKLVITNNKEPNFENFDRELIEQNKLAIGIIFTICGNVFFQAGEEFGRTKLGDENSYKSSAKLNAIDWNRTKEFNELVKFYKRLIKIRKELPILYNGENNYIKSIEFLENNENLISFILTKNGNCIQKYEKIMVIYNPNENTEKIKLYNKDWHIILGENCFFKEEKFIISKKSICILGNITK